MLLAVTLKQSPGVISGESSIGATIYSVIHRTFRFRPEAIFNELGECRSGVIFNELGECRPGAIFSELGDCRSGERKLGWV